MKKVLFIVPSKSIGGTNSSLSSVISHIEAFCDIKVLIMSSNGSGHYNFLGKAFYNNLLDSFYSNFSQLSIAMKFSSVIMKLLKRVCFILHIPIERLLLKYVANKYQREQSYDIVVGFSEGRAMRLASEFKSPIKYTWIHCEYDRAVDSSINELIYYEKFNKVICVSKYTMELFVHRYPTLRDYTTYIYNLLDVDRILSLSNELIEDTRFKSEKFTIISVGRLDPVKRFTTIPYIAYNLLQRDMEFVWYIIGGSSDIEQENIKINIQKYGVSQNVILLGPKRNPYPYFKNANLYVSTSLSEACPMVFNEAKLLGVPIVSTDFGSAYEFISDRNKITPIEKISDVIYDNYKTMKSISDKYYKLEDVYQADQSEREKVEQLFKI